MRNKFYIVLLLGLFCLLPSKINALENGIYYQNENGVVLTKEEYDFLSKFYWDGYQSMMTQEEYTKFKNSNIMNSELEVKEVLYYEGGIVPFTSFITQADRSLKIVKGCTSTCTISVTLTWLKEPTIKSYDVIGAYVDGTTINYTPFTTVSANGSRIVISDLKKTSNGIGSSFKLPTGSNLIINQTFEVNPGGHVYASYQHALKTSTLLLSKDYTFSRFGYGGVFSFSVGSKNYYDAMNGVDIAV